MKKITILHISCIDNEKNGGVPSVVPKFVKYQSEYANTCLLDIKGTYVTNIDFNKYNYRDYNCIKKLPTPYNKPDIVIFHEVYKKEYISLYKECIKNSIPYIVVPHCCMTKYAQKSKKIKKIIGNLLLFNKFLKHASSIHYLSNIEKEYSKCLINDSFIIGNGYVKEYDLKYDSNNSSNYFVYVGRYDMYHKGLDYLINACEYCQDWFRNNNLYLKLYGVTKEQEVKLRESVKKKNLNDFVLVNGSIYGKDKINMITNSIAFIQTSRFEGLPQGISEALMYGVPCIVTKGTAFYEYVDKKKCGIPVDYSPNSIKMALINMYNDSEIRNNYSLNAVKNSKDDFDWKNISKKCLYEYEKILKK